MSTLKTGALRGTSGTADSVQLHASDQSVTFPGAVTIAGALTSSTTGFGKIGQVVTQIYEPSSDDTTDSTTYVDTGMTLQITPSNTNSKILIFGVSSGHSHGSTSSNSILNIKRAVSGGSTDVLSSKTYGLAHTYNTDATVTPIFFVDGTTGTAQRTYTVQQRTNNTNHNTTAFRGDTSNMFMLMEILP